VQGRGAHGAFVEHEDAGFEHAVAEGLQSKCTESFGSGRRDERRHARRAQRLEVLADDARVVEARAVVEDERGVLAHHEALSRVPEIEETPGFERLAMDLDEVMRGLTATNWSDIAP
jgi:hypothetical protein